MNGVEIEKAVIHLAEEPFNPEEFPYEFLRAFGNGDATIKRLRSGTTNKSDINGVLQRNNIHIAVCEKGTTSETLKALRDSPVTVSQKAKFILATDGEWLEAENLFDDAQPPIFCEYTSLPDYLGIFLPLAGISPVGPIRDSFFDIRATLRLNKLYVELLKLNPKWGKADKREEMNHFFARLIFCFFSEDTGIFSETGLFTDTIIKMSDRTGDNTHQVISEIFRAMKIPSYDRGQANLPRFANAFPYVNGGMFSGSADTPIFNRMTRSYLTNIGGLDWTKVNPDIFGSMIQAVADDEERGKLGMHYTNRANILKVLNPLFLDALKARLEEAGDNSRMLLNLRKRIINIRVFDPACGSGNFLVIAYKELRAIEHTINKRRGEENRKSEINIANFKGIELRGFSCEIARLALVIAEYQCDVSYRGRELALNDFLPLQEDNWIVQGNALRLDWEKICPYSSGNDYEEWETYVCGNPPYKGRNKQKGQEKEDTKTVFENYKGSFSSLDYVANWIIKGAEYCKGHNAKASFVATNSVCQGEQVPLLWPLIFDMRIRISFAYLSFKWSNLASHNAGVTVIILGLDNDSGSPAYIFERENVSKVKEIGPYLVPNTKIAVKQANESLFGLPKMYLGNMPKDGGNLIFSQAEARKLISEHNIPRKYIKSYFGAEEIIHATPRACLWVNESGYHHLLKNPVAVNIFNKVREFRSDENTAASTRKMAEKPYRFVQLCSSHGDRAIIIPKVSSGNRQYLPVDYLPSGPTISDKCYVLYDEPLWIFSLLMSTLHIVWIGTVCSRLRTDFSYGNRLGWNTFPIPKLTEQDKVDLTQCAENILLARERHFPATIDDLYDSDNMPSDLKAAHEQNDETLERIYIGRRFRNNTERLEKLFDMYVKKIEGAKK